MWDTLNAGLYLHAGGTSFDASLRRAEVPDRELQLIAAIAVDDYDDHVEQWNFLSSPAVARGAIWVPPHRRNIYVGEHTARWISNLGDELLVQLLTFLTAKATLGEIEDRMVIMTRQVPLFGASVLGRCLLVGYDPDRKRTTASRTHALPSRQGGFELQGCRMYEADGLEYGVVVGDGEASLSPEVADHEDATLQELVTRYVIASADWATDAVRRQSTIATSQSKLVGAVHHLFTKGGVMAKRNVRDVSKYGPELGYDTERKPPADPFAAAEAAAQSLLVQAGSINEQGRNPKHVELFMERVGSLEGQIHELEARVQALRDQADLAKIAVGRQVMGVS